MTGPQQPPYGPPPYGPPPGNQPWPYPYPVAPPLPPQPPLPPGRRADRALSLTLWLIAAGVLPLFWFYSLFAMMGVDACSDSTPCRYGFIYSAYGVGWIGAAAAALLSFLAMHVAKKRGRLVWPWAVAGAVAMACCVVGFFLLYKAGLPEPPSLDHYRRLSS